ncbi:MAG TPA: secretin N-terminal domain-containing protein [Humisphaera sp.]|jgi:type II secretory pathway component GspD/PulD (secretin)|nr:secretin N-terminal domain-containing protein [Humisphaera sp.]
MTTISGLSATRCLLQIAFAAVLLPATCAWAQSPATEAAKDAPAAKTQMVIFHLRSAPAATTAKILIQIMGNSNPPKDKGGPTVVVDDRTNSILISGTSEQVLVAEQFLLKLDTSTQEMDRDAVIEKRLDQLEQQLQTLLSDLKSLREQLKPATQPDGKSNPGATSR